LTPPRTPTPHSSLANDSMGGDTEDLPLKARLSPMATPVELSPGTPVGEYEVAGKIGEGGMGTVYAAVHPLIGKKVAIKVLNAGLSEDPTVVQRFIQEARSVNQIGHRNIVDIFAFGQLDNGRHYYVMEFLKGVSLRKRMDAAEPLRYAEALHAVAEVLSALEAAHQAGVVHRDLKPDNIFLVEGRDERTVKLLDFGIAKLLGRGPSLSQTRTGATLGTPYYMAPEQCRSKAVDARSDLYAMGVIMYEIFAGRLPFPGPDHIDVINGHLSRTPPLPSEFAEVPGDLEALILQCMEKEPDRRPGDAAEVRRRILAIDPAVGERVVPPSKRGLAISGTQEVKITSRPTPSPPRPTPSPPRSGSSRRRVGLVVAGAAILVVAGVTVLAVRHQKPPAPRWELNVNSNPVGATVLIDGRVQPEKTPARIELDRREVIVRVEKESYQPRDLPVQLAETERQRFVNVPLDPVPATLHATTSAVDAVWTIDDRGRSEGPSLDVATLAPGRHEVRIEARGMQTREESIVVHPAERAVFEWPLHPAPGGATKRRSSGHSALTDVPASDFRAPR
jgi:serine/threonine protein kinase